MSELKFDEVTVQYGAGRHSMVAVDAVSLVVPDGKVVGLVGESGSGKSTLARAAVGLTPLSGGRILIDGHPVPTRRRRGKVPIQMVFQDPFGSLDPRMTVGSSIREAMPQALRRSRTRAREEVERLLELVNIDPQRAHSLPAHLSGGQRQRIAVARALAGDPRIVIADEVTSALDVSVQGTVLNVVRDLQRDLDLTMLFISHNLAVVRYISDVVAVMYLGRIVEVGPTEQVIADPRHPYTQELLAAVPSRGGDMLATRHADPAQEKVADHEPPDPHAPPTGCRFHTRCPVGPLVLSDRSNCRSDEPAQRDVGFRHQAACHYALRALTADS
jgi:peptide/nickel transport system ATP-binding protein